VSEIGEPLREARGADYESDAEPQNVVELVARITSANR